MWNKKFIVGIIVLIAFTGLILSVKAIVSKPKAKKTAAAAAKAKTDLKKKSAPRVISKGKGALTVKILNSKNVEIPMRIRAFKAIDGKSSVYAVSSVGGRMQELTPGTYDIEVDSVPQKIFKNIKVVEGKLTIVSLGCVMGSVTVKTTDAKKTAAKYPVRILYSDTNDMVTAYTTNRTIEIVPGVYDIEVGTSPVLYKKNVKVVRGKEVIIDMGCVAGSITVKTVDEKGKNVRLSVRITEADTNRIVSSTTSNKSIDLGKGRYNVEVLSKPKQSKKDVKVNLGEESAVEFLINSPIVPQEPNKSVARVKRQ